MSTLLLSIDWFVVVVVDIVIVYGMVCFVVVVIVVVVVVVFAALSNRLDPKLDSAFLLWNKVSLHWDRYVNTVSRARHYHSSLFS